MDAPAWIAAGAAVLAVVLNIALHVWRGGKHSVADLKALESRLTQTIAEVARDLETKSDDIAKMVGDSITAIREQMRLNEKELVDDIHQLSERMSDVEKWARDEFVRKESFREVAADMKNTMLENRRDVNAAVQSLRDTILSAITGKPISHDAHLRDPG